MFQRFRKFVAEKCARALSPYLEAEIQSYRGEMGLTSGAGSGSFSERTALGVASFHSAVKLVSELAASLQLEVQERVPGTDRWTAIVDHDLEWLLNSRPNSLQTGSAFQRLRYVHYLVHGRSATVIRWQDGRPVALWPLHPSAFTPIDDPIRGRVYQCQFQNKVETCDQSEILDVMGMSVDGLVPLSPIRQFSQNLDLASGTRDQAASFYRNQPKPGLIITSDKRLTQDEYKQLKQRLDESYSGTKAGRSLLLEKDYKFEQSNPMTFADYQLLEILSQNDTDIGEKIFNLPPRDLKGYERISHLEKYVLGPFLLHDSQVLSNQLPPTVDLRRLRIRHNLKGLVELDLKTRYESYRVGIMSGFLRINEVRGLLNLEPDPEGDKLYLPQSVFGKPGSTPVVNPMKGNGRSLSDDPAAEAAIEGRSTEPRLENLPDTVNPEYHGILTDVLCGLMTREQHAIARLARKPLEWRAEVESWYGEHEATVRTKLRHMPDERSRLILDVIGEHRAALLHLAGSPDLSVAAARLSEQWPADAAALALTLLS